MRIDFNIREETFSIMSAVANEHIKIMGITNGKERMVEKGSRVNDAGMGEMIRNSKIKFFNFEAIFWLNNK